MGLAPPPSFCADSLLSMKMNVKKICKFAVTLFIIDIKFHVCDFRLCDLVLAHCAPCLLFNVQCSCAPCLLFNVQCSCYLCTCVMWKVSSFLVKICSHCSISRTGKILPRESQGNRTISDVFTKTNNQNHNPIDHSPTTLLITHQQFHLEPTIDSIVSLASPINQHIFRCWKHKHFL